ncbi:MAG: cofactor-independent phosphoglycerate mutase, partial [Planctomycetaceae bacterium]
MKYALVIPDGAADEPQPALGGQTPLQAARMPHIDGVARGGIVGRADHVPASMPSGSDVGTMSLFGYDPLRCHTGRAPLEAAAQGIELADGDWAIRCNLVTVTGGVMRSFTAGQVSNEDARELIALMQRSLEDSRETASLSPTSPPLTTHHSPWWKFHAGVSYRNLLLYRARGESAPFSDETRTVPPHDVTDQPVAPHLPSGPGSDRLRELMDRSAELFSQSAVNRRRRERGELPATQIWLWGQGRRPALEPFAQKFGKTGAVITAVDLLRGLGRLLGWKIIHVPGGTGYLDTDLDAKGRA